MNQGYGEGTLSHAIFERIKNLKADIIIIDGVRWESDVELVRIFPKNYLIYITADLKTRYERLKKRGEKEGEEETTFEQFVSEENAANELLIPKIGKGADFKIENNGSFEELKKEVREFTKRI